jgi:putative transposase
MHVVARCNNREFAFTTPDDFAVLLAHLRELRRTYEVTLYAYTLMSNHVHLLLQAPEREALSRPLRWRMTETAKAFHKARGRRGHFWERRFGAVLVEDDLYALAALRYLDRNPVRERLGADPVSVSLVELCSLCPRHPESSAHVPPELPGPEPAPGHPPAALPDPPSAES